ncbi:hypothetical protein E2562_024374 [Oryza meyeriana var. granulata]|uniref:Uncharacterized protein n=1 Tax=Oryza meyeriana var. granulata TaxID=110450 RepID=A0A6G1C8S0_9ORYZ|nr:hypothetical protein E2562_024374 [Oryza meyeriana var. granulata]
MWPRECVGRALRRWCDAWQLRAGYGTGAVGVKQEVVLQEDKAEIELLVVGKKPGPVTMTTPADNASASGSDSLITRSEMKREQVKQWEQWQKGKAPENSTGTSVTATTTGHFSNFANYAHMGEGERDWEEDWDWSQA